MMCLTARLTDAPYKSEVGMVIAFYSQEFSQGIYTICAGTAGIEFKSIAISYSKIKICRVCNEDKYDYHTFAHALSGRTDRFTVIAFSNVSDNPFTGSNAGYALVFHDGLIHLPTVFDAIGILPNSSPIIQYARIRISS